VCGHIYIDICVWYVCVCACGRVGVYVCMRVCVYVCMCVYVCKKRKKII
jgi:hypothetical protein